MSEVHIDQDGRRLFDISPLIDRALPVWPGEPSFSASLSSSIAAGAPVNVSVMTTTTHLGAHADAPFHLLPSGRGIAALPLLPFLGRCQVLSVPPVPELQPKHLPLDHIHAPRLLLQTGSVRDRNVFPHSFTALGAALANTLVHVGLLLLGIDTPSVDPFESKTLDAHHALIGGGVQILEGLVLDDVPEGIYELIALPLRIGGIDASPVRAVLRQLDA
jgi:arylformamidase